MNRLQRLLLVAAGLLMSGPAMAEHLVFIAADQASLRDSGDLATVIDHAGYSLPGGYSVVGADGDPDDGSIGLLGRNASSGLCQVFAEADDVGENFGFTPVGPTVACAANVGDLEFIASGSGPDLGWAIAKGASAIVGNQSSGQYETLTVSSPDGLSIDLAAIALRGVDGDIGRLLIRANGGTLGVLENENGDSAINFINPVALSGATISGPTSMDISEASGIIYLLTAGNVYTVNDGGVATLLGAAPAGTLAVFVDQSGDSNSGGDDNGNNNGSGNNSDDGDAGGGGVKVGAIDQRLLLLMVLALGLKYGLRYRRSRQ